MLSNQGWVHGFKSTLNHSNIVAGGFGVGAAGPVTVLAVKT